MIFLIQSAEMVFTLNEDIIETLVYLYVSIKFAFTHRHLHVSQVVSG